MRVAVFLCTVGTLVSASAFGEVDVHTDQASFLAALLPGFYLETFDTTETDFFDPPLGFSQSGFSYDVTLFDPPVSVLLPFTIPSGDPNDIARTDQAVLECIDRPELQRWIKLAAEQVAYQGLPARICWLAPNCR